MSPIHVHLLVNHVPVLGTLIAAGLLAWAMRKQSADMVRASLTMFVLFALAGWAAYLTGEPAEHLVKRMAGFSHDAIELHERAALLATALLGALGVLALSGLIAFRRRATIPRGYSAVMLALALVPLASMAWTAYLGGQIRHTEILPERAASSAAWWRSSPAAPIAIPTSAPGRPEGEEGEGVG
jgi:drug/metabolite transporter (DMT)-like permease